MHDIQFPHSASSQCCPALGTASQHPKGPQAPSQAGPRGSLLLRSASHDLLGEPRKQIPSQIGGRPSVRCAPLRAPQRRRGGVGRHSRGAAPPAHGSRLQAIAHVVWQTDGEGL